MSSWLVLMWMSIAVLVECAYEFHYLDQHFKAILGTAIFGLVPGNGLREVHMA